MKVKLAGGRLILAARVVSALDHFDLALLLWAVRSWARTRVLAELIKDVLTGREIAKRTGLLEGSVYRALRELQGADLVERRTGLWRDGREGPCRYIIARTGLEPEGREV